METIKFESPRHMYECIAEGNDLYSKELGIYVFVYNEAGALCYYNLSLQEVADILAKQKTADQYEYWGAFLGPGGYILDNSEFDEHRYSGGELHDKYIQPSLDFCEQHFAVQDWVLTDDVTLEYLAEGQPTLADLFEAERQLKDLRMKVRFKLLNEYKESIEQQKLEGVTPISSSPAACSVRFSTLAKEGSWSAETYNPKSQMLAVMYVLDRCESVAKMAEAVQKMLKIGYADQKLGRVYLNSATRRILEESELAKLVS